VGSTVSYSSLARDLDRDPKTIKNWLQILENLYIIFSLTPYSKKIARSIKKEPKFYFYDLARVAGDPSSRLENLVALSLKKELQYLKDAEGLSSNFHFVRTKEKREIDFYIEIPKKNKIWLIEVKTSDESPSPSMRHLSPLFKEARKLQLVQNLKRETSYPDGLEVRQLSGWMKTMSLIDLI
jgi:uncharacterized protein